MNAAPLAGTNSRGAIAILHDVTPREHLERVKRDFIANVSHEFRTPLATIRGYAETLLDGGLEDRENRRKFVEIIQANGIRLNNIAADLLTLSDLEAGRPEPEPESDLAARSGNGRGARRGAGGQPARPADSTPGRYPMHSSWAMESGWNRHCSICWTTP